MKRGHRVMFIPKFHCKINPIECVWYHAKRYTRAHCDYSFAGLEKIIDIALDSVTVEVMRKFYRKVREYHRTYREEVTVGKEMLKTLKVYKVTVVCLKMKTNLTTHNFLILIDN